MASKRTEYFNGNKGEVWCRGVKIGTVSKGKIVTKYNYEEIPAEDGDGVVRVKTGETNEISMTFRPNGTERDIDMFNLSEDVTVTMANTNIGDSARKRVRADGVTWDENPRINFEKKKVEEIELSGQAESVEDLE